MTRALVAFTALVVLVGCGGPKPPAPASTAPRSEPATSVAVPQSTPPSGAAPASPPAPPQTATPPAAAPPAPSPSVAPDPAQTPQVLYVKTHLANFREGAGTSRKILRVLRQGARLQVLETRTTWLRVRLDDGLEGWVAESVTSVTAPITPARAPTPRVRPTRVAAA